MKPPPICRAGPTICRFKPSNMLGQFAEAKETEAECEETGRHRRVFNSTNCYTEYIRTGIRYVPSICVGNGHVTPGYPGTTVTRSLLSRTQLSYWGTSLIRNRHPP